MPIKVLLVELQKYKKKLHHPEMFYRMPDGNIGVFYLPTRDTQYPPKPRMIGGPERG